MSKVTVSHDPRECRQALAGASAPVVVDLETTGLHRADAIVSAGVLVKDTAFILFTGSRHASILNISRENLAHALEPLARPDLVVMGHNFRFDLGFLARAGIPFRARVVDTLKLLRLLDQDRGGDKAERRRPRIDRRAPVGTRLLLNYRLKDAVPQLLGVRLRDFPGRIEAAPYHEHALYLANDLVGTRLLGDFLWGQLDHQLRRYHDVFVAPLTPLLCAMTEYGVQADTEFIDVQAEELAVLCQRLSDDHQRRHGVALGMDKREMLDWLFGRGNLALPLPYAGRRGASLKDSSIERLQELAAARNHAAAVQSLQTIRDYRKATSLLVRLRSLLKHVDRRTGRIHSAFDDRQASGRVSSHAPNLQQLANTRTIDGLKVVTRNALIATPGHKLVVADISQADLRVLANAVETFGLRSEEYLAALRRERVRHLRGEIGPFLAALAACRNHSYTPQPQQGLAFEPSVQGNFFADLIAGRDLYRACGERILGRPTTDEERKQFKPLVLGQVNGQGAPSLARAMKCSVAEAQTRLDAFRAAYPKETAFTEMMYGQIALTGQTRTFAGRLRTDTAQRWLVAEPRVEILVSYRRGDAYWLEIVPLEPSRRVLTSYILRAWDARTRPRRLIYDHQRGRLSGHSYRLFADGDLLYRLPCRNWAWRSIRRVRARGEEAGYQGLDATCRSLFNFIAQGGTADVTKAMMLRSQETCRRFGARLLLQVHDELVFEVPSERAEAFSAAVQPVLEAPPCPTFRVPIKVKSVLVERFGDAK
jgi:DNA polymerase I-like protein with 3'-5' exonuclease and polymerase domains